MPVITSATPLARSGLRRAAGQSLLARYALCVAAWPNHVSDTRTKWTARPNPLASCRPCCVSLLPAMCQHQDIAAGFACGIERRDRRNPMKDTAVIEKHGVKRISKSELSQRSTVGRKDLRNSARHIGPVDQHHAHP